MSKINVFALPRPERPEETRTFEEGGVTLALTLTAPDAADMARAAELAGTLTRDYITGSDIREAGPFPEGVKVSEALFQAAAMVCEMQAGPAHDRYSAVEFVLLSVKLPRTWAQVQAWATELVSAWSARRGN